TLFFLPLHLALLVFQMSRSIHARRRLLCLGASIFYLLGLAEKKGFNYFGDMACEMLHFRRLRCNSQHSVNCSAARYWLSRFFPTLGLVRQQSKRVSEVMCRFYSG